MRCASSARRVELITIGGATIGRAVFEPGWRWATSVQPIANTKSCEAPHFQYHVSGVLRIKMDDGTEFDWQPGRCLVVAVGSRCMGRRQRVRHRVDFQGNLITRKRRRRSSPPHCHSEARPRNLGAS